MSSSTFPGAGVPVSPGTVAPVGGRVGAFVIDGLVGTVAYGVGLVLVAVTGRANLVVVGLVLAVLVGVGQWFAEAFTGATVGSALLGYRTVSTDTGAPAGLVKILVRQVVVAVGSLACGVGAFVVVASGAFDDGPAQRGWHDKAAGTLVLRASALRPRKSGAGAWNQAVERAVGGGAAPAQQPVRPLPVVPPMPEQNEGSAWTAPADRYETAALPTTTGSSNASPNGAPAASTGAPEWTRLPEPSPSSPWAAPTPTADTAPPTPPPAMTADTAPPVRPRGGPVASAYTERLAAAQAAENPAAWQETVAAQEAASRASQGGSAGAPGAPAEKPAPSVAADPKPATAPLITGYPGQPGVVPVPRAEDLGDLEYTRLRESMPQDRDAVLRMVFDTGQQFDVTGDGIVGRSPEGEMGIVHVVVIDDPARSVSKVHVSFGLTPAGDELWVIDRASVNGTVLVDPDGVAATLPAGTRALVGPGWTIRFGQRSARVERR